MKLNYANDICGKVPLHQTNLIQPHGVLLIVSRNELRIIQASENAQEIFGASARDIVDTSLSEYADAQQLARLREQSERPTIGKLPFVFSLTGGRHIAAIQVTDQYLVIEIEKEARRDGAEESFLSIYQELKYVMAAIEGGSDLITTCNIAIHELKKISGFDKIMVYQFDDDWNGDVIAEVLVEGMDNYLGLKFPSSDIPPQARALYQKIPYRLIPTIDYEPVRLYPVINPITNAFTDLSDSNLRSVAAVHIEYLRNMRVNASMSTRILVDGKLWGLIACHHRTPKYLSFETCSVFELVSTVISAKVSAVEKGDAFAYRTGMQETYTRLVEEVYRENDLAAGFYHGTDELLRLLNADGAALVMNRQIDVFGNTPSTSFIEDLVIWLQSAHSNRLYHQPHLPSVYEPAEAEVEVASGLVALPIIPERGAYLLAFRAEVVRKVNWSGNPNEALLFEADRKNYHPRHSFELWQQTVQQSSMPWQKDELEIAEQLRNFAVEFTLSKFSVDIT